MPLNSKIKYVTKQSAQDMQDDIFRRMSADKKLEIAGKLWLLAKAIDPQKIDFRKYGRNRSASSPD